MTDPAVPSPLMPSDPVAAYARPGLDLYDALLTLRRYVALVVAILIGGLVTALVLTLVQTPTYTAAASLEIDDAATRILGQRDAETDLQAVSSPGDTERFLNTQLDVIRSEALALRVVRRLRLTDNTAFLRAMLVRSGEHPGESDLAGRLRDHLTLSLPRQSRFVTLAFTSADPAISAAVANAYVGEAIEANLQRRYDTSQYARDFLSHQLEQAKARLEDSEKSLNAYARSTGLIRTHSTEPTEPGGGATDGSITTSSLNGVNTSADQARARRIEAEGRWTTINSGPLMSSREVLSNPTIETLLARRAELQTSLDKETINRLDEHPIVLQLQAEIRTVNSQIRQIAESIRNSVYQDYRSALEAENALRGQVDQLKKATLAEQDSGVRYGILAREVQTNRTLYEGLLQRYKDLSASAGISNSNIQLIDLAEAPKRPSAPSLSQNLAIALLVALALALVVVALRIQIDDLIRVPEDVERKLGLPLLGLTPRAADGAIIAELEDTKSAPAEAYNTLRAAIGLAVPAGQPFALLLTSSMPREGKSTSAYALARAFARLGRQVVLVDLDLRRPALHRLLEVDNDAGVSSLLASRVSLDETLRFDERIGVHYLTSGPKPSNPSELIGSGELVRLVAQLRDRFDVTIIDGPPILGLADAPLAASVVTHVLHVVQSNVWRSSVVRASLRRLGSARSKLLGAVLTKYDRKSLSAYTYYYYSSEYYDYGTDNAAPVRPWWAIWRR